MKKITLVLIALLGASSAMASANIVTNGSFETLPGALQNTTWGQFSALDGWVQTVTNYDKFEIQHATNFQTTYTSFNKSYDLEYYLELNANKLGDISQTLTTVAGQSYTLTFGYSGRSDSGAGKDSLLNVYWNGGLITPVALDETPNSGWKTFSYTLAATGTSTALRFQSIGPSNNASYGSYLDGVSVTAVPEPESYAMLLAGLGLMGTIARRRNKKA